MIDLAYGSDASPKAAPSFGGRRYFLRCAFPCALLFLFQFYFENSFTSPVATSLPKDTVSGTNATLLQLRQAEQIIATLTSANDANSAKIAKLRQRLEESERRSEDPKEPRSSTDVRSVAFDPNDVCSSFPAGTPASATRLWRELRPRILEVAKNSEIAEYRNEKEFAALRNILEDTLSPARLRRAVRHLPTFSHHILRHVMDIVQKRLRDPQRNPPLRIAVFGGSVTLGRDCLPRRMQHKDCAWPARLESLINGVVGRDVVKVYNLAIGGTHSGTATNRVKYWMYNYEELNEGGADVIVNSYSTNDSFPPWQLEWPKDDVIGSTADQIHERLQAFIREALLANPCGTPPLVVHVDDYLGPQQPALMGELAYVGQMTQLAKWYDTVAISSAEVVRDLVYYDNSAAIFTGKGDVHFGHLGHQTVAWAVGFAGLQLLANYCDDEHNAARDEREAEAQRRRGLVPKAEMIRDGLFLPPPLTRKFLLKDATAAFNAALVSSHQISVTCNTTGSNATGMVDKNPCVVAWISTPGNWNAEAIKKFMTKHATANKGWAAERQGKEGWSNKDGWAAVEEGASMRLRFPNVEKDVRTMTIYFLRSYGDKWKDSKATFVGYRRPAGGDPNAANANVVAETSIAGVHEDKTSSTISETVHFSDTVAKGETVDIQIDLVSGTTFKIMGMMLCNK